MFIAVVVTRLIIPNASQYGSDDGEVSQKNIDATLLANQISAWCMAGTIIALIIRLFLKRKQ